MTGARRPLGIGIIGAGRIGTSHAELLARHLPGARLVAMGDPRPEAAEALGGALGVRPSTDAGALIADDEVDAVVFAATSEAHTDLVVACARPLRSRSSARSRWPSAWPTRTARLAAIDQAGSIVQVGFNRRFAAGFRAAHDAAAAGAVAEFQVADVPGRCEPGTGEIAYPAVARALADAGYTGTVGLERMRPGKASWPSSVSASLLPSDVERKQRCH